jgi:hypothetical protein
VRWQDGKVQERRSRFIVAQNSGVSHTAWQLADVVARGWALSAEGEWVGQKCGSSVIARSNAWLISIMHLRIARLCPSLI